MIKMIYFASPKLVIFTRRNVYSTSVIQLHSYSTSVIQSKASDF
jgi:hypothetical protein